MSQQDFFGGGPTKDDKRSLSRYTEGSRCTVQVHSMEDWFGLMTWIYAWDVGFVGVHPPGTPRTFKAPFQSSSQTP